MAGPAADALPVDCSDADAVDDDVEVREAEEEPDAEVPEVFAPAEDGPVAAAPALLPPVASEEAVPVVGDSPPSEEALLPEAPPPLPPWSFPLLVEAVAVASAEAGVVPAACAAVAVADVGRTVMKLDDALTSIQSRS